MPLHLKHDSTQGFSLIEILVALGVGAIVLLATKDSVLESIRLQKMAKERSRLQFIEQDIRRAVFDKTSFGVSASKNPPLGTCVNLDDKPCKVEAQDFKLYLTPTLLASGNFGFPGQSCSSAGGCPIEVKTSFTPICAVPTNCDAAQTLQIDYQIFVSGALFKKGMIRLENGKSNFSDEAVSCDFDKDNRPTFASKVEPGKLSCIPAPSLTRNVVGVKPGDCKANLEVLVGFAADGSPICKPLKRTTI
jgi:prepilin-type N-terminal cleavage/methylation domain-containing protein